MSWSNTVGGKQPNKHGGHYDRFDSPDRIRLPRAHDIQRIVP